MRCLTTYVRAYQMHMHTNAHAMSVCALRQRDVNSRQHNLDQI